VRQLSLLGGIYRGELDLHQPGEVGLVLGDGRLAKPHGQPAGWSGVHRHSPSVGPWAHST
jgi:hypothetical protein